MGSMGSMGSTKNRPHILPILPIPPILPITNPQSAIGNPSLIHSVPLRAEACQVYSRYSDSV